MLSQIHGGNLHQMHMNLRNSLLSSKHRLHERITKIMLIKFPILAGCSTRVMEKIAVLLMGSTTIHPGFHGDGIP